MNRLIFGSMRVVRAVLGAYCAAAFVSLLMTLIQLAAGSAQLSGLLLVTALFAVSFAMFVGMRRAINALHVKRLGVPHPRMNRFAAL